MAKETEQQTMEEYLLSQLNVAKMSDSEFMANETLSKIFQF